MKIILTKVAETILADRDRRPTEEIEVEVFLDFDPVFPGWPPERTSRKSAQKQQKGDQTIDKLLNQPESVARQEPQQDRHRTRAKFENFLG